MISYRYNVTLTSEYEELPDVIQICVRGAHENDAAYQAKYTLTKKGGVYEGLDWRKFHEKKVERAV